MKVLLTGASGKIASALTELPFDWILSDIKANENSKHPFIKADLSIKGDCQKICADVEAIVHLGGSSSTESTWDEVLNNNICGTKNLFDAALEKGVRRIIYASSNHVMGGYEKKYEAFYHSEVIKTDPLKGNHLFWPDSFYGVSKLFGEGLGRYYHSWFGLEFISLRLGSVLDPDHDHPYGYADIRKEELQGYIKEEEYNALVNRLRATWLSRRDFKDLVKKALEADVKFGIYNGLSANNRRWFDLKEATEELGYKPQDNGEIYIRKA